MKIAIIGAGKLGIKVAQALIGGNHSVTIVDKNEQILQKLDSQMDIMTVIGNGKEVSLLKEIHIATFDFLLACTDRDEKNIVIASFAKKLGCRTVIARVRDPEHLKQLDFIKATMGIDYLVNPELALANEIYKTLTEKYSLTNGIITSGQFAILEADAQNFPQLLNLEIKDSSASLPNMLILAISRNGKVIIPHGDTVVLTNDIIYIIGSIAEIEALNKDVHSSEVFNNLKKVMIIGGGKAGLFLAEKLATFGVSVKLIEQDRDRCYYLANRLPDVMVLHGDGSDQNLLDDENIEGMDAVVTTTGFDEDNLLLALLAKNKGVEDTIAKVSRGLYSEMISNMGVDMVLNPLDITASNILHLAQGSKRSITSSMIQGQAEVIEIEAGPHMKLVNKALKSISLPKGMLIAAVYRGGNIIIPNGDTVIRIGDRVVVAYLLSEIANFEGLISTKG